MKRNLDPATVESFGDEWSRFDQSAVNEAEALQMFGDYFAIFPWEKLPSGASGFDMGCGSGRWAQFVAPRVGQLHCIDPSDAVEVASRALADHANVSFHRASVDDHVLPADSQDFGYSLGVLHHVPDTEEAIRSCVVMLKKGAPFLIYLYYALDNRSFFYRLVWKMTDTIRAVVSKLPFSAKRLVTDLIAGAAYFPLAKLSLLLSKAGFDVSGIPLSHYRKSSFYTMRTDARDRFGTPLEQRFNRTQVARMMEVAGLCDIHFSDRAPFWCAVGFKK